MQLQRFSIPTPIKLSLLWTALMWLYIYNDYFSLYLPGTIDSMSAGIIGPLGEATELVLVSVSLILVIPAMLIYLSCALPPVFSKWANVGFGVIYTGLQALTFPGSEPFYQMVVVFEVLITLTIVLTAWQWPVEN